MSATSFVARMHNAWRALVNPTATVVEYELSQDRTARHPDERIPTKRQYATSRNGAVGMEIRVKKTNRQRAAESKNVQAAKAEADAADKRLVDYASLPSVVEVRERAANLRAEHPRHEERLAFRAVRLPKWARLAIETVIIIADWGVWFTLLMMGMGLSFTKMASPTDPTKVYNPDWFLAHPAEWVTAFVVPTLAALFTLAVGKLAARRWAQRAAQKDHPERAGEIAATITRGELRGWVTTLVALSLGLYLVAATTFIGFADGAGWLIGAPWAVIPLCVFFVERYGQDPIGEVDALILESAASVEAQKMRLTEGLMAAENSWRAAWITLDDLIREIIDGASGDINLWDQLYMQADAKSGYGKPLAPISDGAQPIVGRTITVPVSSGETPARAVPVVLEAQRGLITEVAPWITKQIEQDIQILADCRPSIDGGEERTTRITKRFETAYAAAVKECAERGSGGRGPEAGAAPVTNSDRNVAEIPLTGLEEETWDPSSLLAEEAARQ